MFALSQSSLADKAVAHAVLQGGLSTSEIIMSARDLLQESTYFLA